MNLNGLLARVVAELTVSSGSRLEQMPPPPPPRYSARHLSLIPRWLP